jgi:SAM-dependent methyltransferase
MNDFDVLEYWENRYQAGRGSGPGSRRRAARLKGNFVNTLIEREGVHSVIDWGCGDGRVASRLRVERYLGLDVSPEALRLCEEACREHDGWEFLLYDGFTPPELPQADLALSLDVIFHLVDDAMYHRHLELVFGSAPLVLIQSSNKDERGRAHVLHRRFIYDMPTGWSLMNGGLEESDGEIGMWLFRKEQG